jgi:hypothetical protein
MTSFEALKDNILHVDTVAGVARHLRTWAGAPHELRAGADALETTRYLVAKFFALHGDDHAFDDERSVADATYRFGYWHSNRTVDQYFIPIHILNDEYEPLLDSVSYWLGEAHEAAASRLLGRIQRLATVRRVKPGATTGLDSLLRRYHQTREAVNEAYEAC